jgi:uridine phosphorylase
MSYSDSELILNADGSIYHLHLVPEQVAPLVIFVGDPDRVGKVSQYFDAIMHRVQHREFVTHTGILRGQPISVVSTGIGTDNIDIVMTELDALVNIDFNTRTPKAELTSLKIVRIGTSGSLQESVAVDAWVVTDLAVGFDSLMHFYDADLRAEELSLCNNLGSYLENRSDDLMLVPYVFSANGDLLQLFDNEYFTKAITVTAPGFYAPQGRILRGVVAEKRYLNILKSYKFKERHLTNFEMETAGIYGMARLLGHQALSVSAILANRAVGTFSENAETTVDNLIKKVLVALVP